MFLSNYQMHMEKIQKDNRTVIQKIFFKVIKTRLVFEVLETARRKHK